MADKDKRAMEFALYSRRNGEGYEAFAPAGVWINTAGAVAGDYISFIQGVCEIILTSARDALADERLNALFEGEVIHE